MKGLSPAMCIGDGVGDKCPSNEKLRKNLGGKYYVKFGHFVDFSPMYFLAKCLAPKLTESSCTYEPDLGKLAFSCMP